MKNRVKRFLSITLIVIGISASGIASAGIQVPNGDFENWESFTPDYRVAPDNESCVLGGNTISRPAGWESWYDQWCDSAQDSYCKPCDYLTCRTSTEAHTGSRSMRLNAANRIGWTEGTSETWITHDGSELPNKLKGHYKKTGDSASYFAHYIDPQIFYLRKNADLDLFYLCQPGMLSGCPFDPDDLLLSVVVAASGEDHLKLGATDVWTAWEREIPVLPPAEAAEVGTIVIRVRHLAANVSEYALVDDMYFEFPSTETCELDWNGDGVVGESDYLVGDPIGGFYAEWYIHTYYPSYYPILFPTSDTARLDWDESGAIDQNDLMGPLDAALESEGYYVQWYIYMFYPGYYPIFMPETTAVCIG